MTAADVQASNRGLSFLDDMIARRALKPAAQLAGIGALNDQALLERLWLHDQADRLGEVQLSNAHIVTGFGPTSAPTAGTLSMVFRARELQAASGISLTTVVSDLGAWCSRTTPADELRRNTDRFLTFLEKMGLGGSSNILRTHQDLPTLSLAAVLGRYLRTVDFQENSEVFAGLYDRLGLLGGDFGVCVDASFTVADILGPALIGKRRVLVLAGIEEHYFVDLARLAADRLGTQTPQWPDDLHVSAVYGRLVGGFAPFEKMSKSIPASAISLADSEDELARKILEEREQHADLLLQLTQLASPWLPEEVTEAELAHASRQRDPGPWHRCMERYLLEFLELRTIWAECDVGLPHSILDHLIVPS